MSAVYDNKCCKDASGTVCIICGGRNASVRYGAVCCPSCAAFFARTTRNRGQEPYRCPMAFPCPVMFSVKRRCKACRLRKCRDNQMRLPHNGAPETAKYTREPPSCSEIRHLPSGKFRGLGAMAPLAQNSIGGFAEMQEKSRSLLAPVKASPNSPLHLPEKPIRKEMKQRPPLAYVVEDRSPLDAMVCSEQCCMHKLGDEPDIPCELLCDIKDLDEQFLDRVDKILAENDHFFDTLFAADCASVETRGVYPHMQSCSVQ